MGDLIQNHAETIVRSLAMLAPFTVLIHGQGQGGALRFYDRPVSLPTDELVTRLNASILSFHRQALVPACNNERRLLQSELDLYVGKEHYELVIFGPDTHPLPLMRRLEMPSAPWLDSDKPEFRHHHGWFSVHSPEGEPWFITRPDQNLNELVPAAISSLLTDALFEKMPTGPKVH